MKTQQSQKNEWKLEDFQIGEQLGNGKFGYVFKAIEKKNQKEVAIKIIRKNLIEQFNYHSQLKNEIEINCRLKYILLI
jgi:aurora kinase